MTLPLLGKDSGRRCPHRHWEWLWNGDEDVATPLQKGAAHAKLETLVASTVAGALPRQACRVSGTNCGRVVSVVS